jgi:hypothetical protein
MSDELTAPDDGVVADLRRLASAIDPVPDELRVAIHAAISLRDLDRQLADLIADSAGPADDEHRERTSAFEPVRTWTGDGPAVSRLLSFASDDVQIDLEVSEHGDRVDVVGQLSGASGEDCALEYAEGEPVALQVDSLGRFLVSGMRHGPVRARCRSVAGVSVTTAWVII